MDDADLAELSDSEVRQRLERRGVDPLTAAHLVHLRDRDNADAITEILAHLNR